MPSRPEKECPALASKKAKDQGTHLGEAVVGSLATRTPPLEERPLAGESLRHSAELRCNRRCTVRLGHDGFSQADTQTMPFCDEWEKLKVDSTKYMNCCVKIKEVHASRWRLQDDPITSIGGWRQFNRDTPRSAMLCPMALGRWGQLETTRLPVDHSSPKPAT